MKLIIKLLYKKIKRKINLRDLLQGIIAGVVIAAISILLLGYSDNQWAKEQEEQRQEMSLMQEKAYSVSSIEMNNITPVNAVEPVETEINVIYEFNLTQEEWNLLAELVYWEGRGEPFECQVAIIETVFNRANAKGVSISDVVFSPGQYSPTSASCWGTATPNQMQYDAIFLALVTDNYDSGMKYFQAGSFHNWGSLIDYKIIGNTYFSIG